MLPIGNDISTNDVVTVTETSRTYKLDVEKGRITTNIDGLEAIRQFVFKELITNRYEYFIYSFNYGAELLKVLGKDELYARSEVKRLVTEALIVDDRINSVNNFKFEFSGDSMTVYFTVNSIFGNLESEVTINASR